MTSAADKLYSLKMSDTPKTDAESNHIQNVYNDWICRKDLLIDADKGVVDEQFARQLEKELNAANERIKRLEEAGDAMEKYIFDQTNTRFIICAIQWRKAKEAKP